MPPTGQPDVSSLSDEKLSQMLLKYAVDVGPINAATRQTYERRLVKLMTGTVLPPTHNYPPVDDDDHDDDDDCEADEEVQTRLPASKTWPSPILPEPLQPRVRSMREAETRIYPSLSKDRLTTFSHSTPVSRSVPKATPEEETKSISIWLKLLTLGIALTLIYLIYANMEPQAVSSIPEINSKVEV
uniref:LEM domain-containing protein n=1 Tax=Arion vulgaris TaxID=1028688 RepID=A0A0B7A578_9EUPU